VLFYKCAGAQETFMPSGLCVGLDSGQSFGKPGAFVVEPDKPKLGQASPEYRDEDLEESFRGTLGHARRIVTVIPAARALKKAFSGTGEDFRPKIPSPIWLTKDMVVLVARANVKPPRAYKKNNMLHKTKNVLILNYLPA